LAQYKVRKITAEIDLDNLELELYERDILATAPYKLLEEPIFVRPITWLHFRRTALLGVKLILQ